MPSKAKKAAPRKAVSSPKEANRVPREKRHPSDEVSEVFEKLADRFDRGFPPAFKP
jgi:hypothetical protein